VNIVKYFELSSNKILHIKVTQKSYVYGETRSAPYVSEADLYALRKGYVRGVPKCFKRK
jgi:hypothetical protein